jgi:hypothetical protein
MKRVSTSIPFFVLFLFSLVLSQSGCVTAQNADKDKQFEWQYSVKVNAVALANLPQLPMIFVSDPSSKDIRSKRERLMVQKALKKMGKPVLAEASSAIDRIDLELSTETKDPKGGIAIFGNLTPYRHYLTLEGNHKGEQVFLVEVMGGDEFESGDRILPVLVSVAVNYIGRNTAQLESQQVRMSDDAVQELLEP